MPLAGVSGVSAIPGSWALWPVLDPWRGLAPLPAVPEIRGAEARLGGTPLPETFAPGVLPFADMPDVTCCLLVALRAALLSIMSHGRHVKTGVPMTHLYPYMLHLYAYDVILVRK